MTTHRWDFTEYVSLTAGDVEDEEAASLLAALPVETEGQLGFVTFAAAADSSLKQPAYIFVRENFLIRALALSASALEDGAPLSTGDGTIVSSV